MEYYIASNGQNLGPYSVEQLAQQRITPDTMLWTQGMPNWAPASQIPELKQLFSGIQQTPVPPSSVPPTGMPPTGINASHAYRQSAEYNSQVNGIISSLDDGSFVKKPLKTIYMVLAIFGVVGPLAYLVYAINNNLFRNGLTIAMSIINVIVLGIAGAFVVMYFMKRGKQAQQLLKENKEKKSVLPLVTHIIQSVGECYGLVMMTAGAIVKFMTSLFTGLALNSLGGKGSTAIEGLLNGFWEAFISVIMGYLAVCAARYLGEIGQKMSKDEDNNKNN